MLVTMPSQSTRTTDSGKPEASEAIHIFGARQNNLQGVDVSIPLGQITAITGVSGSGKSSLAFDTLYAEGQRRYVESFSPYARQFMDRMDRPRVDRVDGVLPAVAIDQKNAIRASRSTVGTVTELTDFIKLLYSRVAVLHCPLCGGAVRSDEAADAATRLLAAHSGRRALLTFAMPAELSDERERVAWLAGQGYRRLWLAGRQFSLEESSKLEALDRASVVADRLRLATNKRSRLVDSLESALDRGAGKAAVHVEDDAGGYLTVPLSRGRHCAACDVSYPAPVANHFSFNSPLGACEDCNGFGAVIDLDLDLVVPDHSLTLDEGAVRPWSTDSATEERRRLRRFCKEARIPRDQPWRELSAEQRQQLIEGDKARRWYGIRGWFRWLEKKTYKMHVRVFLSRYRAYVTCESCQGSRFNGYALSYRLGGLSLAQLCAMNLGQARDFFDALTLSAADEQAMAPVLREIRERLGYLCQVGVGYLTLNRKSRTLSGGEVQRVNLTTAIGSALVNTLYVLDEPSIGLHARDNERLMEILERLRENRNTVVLVEHDEAIIRRCNHLIDMGPGAGESGGQVVFRGSPRQLSRARKHSLTAQYMAQRSPLRSMEHTRKAVDFKHAITVVGARQNNLKNIDIKLPLGVMTVVTGVSGSGKSTLIEDVLYRGLLRQRGRPVEAAGAHDRIDGGAALREVMLIDQSPVGKTPRSNPATYIKAWDAVRKLFAAEPRAQRLGLGPGAFSFNAPGGRCEACEGRGFERIEMQFLSDQFVSCERCEGRRFKAEVLSVKHRGHTVADLLQMTINGATHFFADYPDVQDRLSALAQVGLGYLRLGQALNTLSGGESQRLKLASHLGLKRTTDCLFLFDEPTTGLHLSDVRLLCEGLRRLCDRGNTVVVIEHHLDLIAQADWLIDLGPEGGVHGGQIVAAGTPEQVSACTNSHTGLYLARHLGLGSAGTKGASRAAEAMPHELRQRAPAEIVVEGARVHNLKNVDLRLPRGQLVAISGPSGSGKSSLAFDVLFAEGQRRFIDCLSPYARQYVAQVGRPDVDQLLGVPPTVCIDQRSSRGGRKSTVGTVTEIYHYLRLIYARIGVQHCVSCAEPVSGLDAARLVKQIVAHHGGKRVRLLAPAVRGRKGFHREVFARAQASGHTQIRVDGAVNDLKTVAVPSRYDEHDIEYVVSELQVPKRPTAALRQVAEQALVLGEGTLYVLPAGRRRLKRYSTELYCAGCGVGFDPPDPRSFSFNSRAGACEDCGGLGVVDEAADDQPNADYRAKCPTCDGTRLNCAARAVKIGGESIDRVVALGPAEVATFFEGLQFTARELAIAEQAIGEIVQRCRFLVDTGLDYLTLDRGAHTLSGGEAQRVRLAAQLSAQLRGVLYVLDEPTIGLHPLDNAQLLRAMRRLVERGNTVVVVEHDEETLRESDFLVDVGPGGGTGGGQIVASGKTEDVLAAGQSPTARCLRAGAARHAHCGRPVTGQGKRLMLKGINYHNLRRVEVQVPLGRLTVVTGVSGSGKSSLVREVLGEGLRRVVRGGTPLVGRIEGARAIKRVREIDQSPIGRTPASTPATYVGLYDDIRRLFAGLPESRARGYKPGRFSFNVRGGRCEQCKGQGRVRHEMSFLPQVSVHCDLCDGRRFNEETQAVRYKGNSIADVLALTVSEALALFVAVPTLVRPLSLLDDLGLGYLRLGQASHTLSGGEAQRIKLVEELQKSKGDFGIQPGRKAGEIQSGVLYLMDEPSTGLHISDLQRLLRVLQRLVDRGDTVVVIEHNLDVIASADWLIDLGPGGGAAGGRVVYQGDRDGLQKHRKSATARFLREHLRPR